MKRPKEDRPILRVNPTYLGPPASGSSPRPKLRSVAITLTIIDAILLLAAVAGADGSSGQARGIVMGTLITVCLIVAVCFWVASAN